MQTREGSDDAKEAFMGSVFLKEAEAIYEDLLKWRRDLHQIPELGTELPRTVAYVSARLDEMGIEHSVFEDCSCIVACIGQGDKCYLLRGDMDALPVEEMSGLEFASCEENSHACGHDMNTVQLLGAAKLLKAHESELKGVVKLFFQSGEEIFAGSKAGIEHGIMENPHVDAALALHVFSPMGIGEAGSCLNPCAGVFGFRITITGSGSHGSAPEQGVDPINTAVHIHLGLQEILAREVSGFDQVALTIGKIQGGNAANVIPNEVVMEGTLRAFDPDLRIKIYERIQQVATDIGRAYRSEIKIDTLSDCPPIVCDQKEFERVNRIMKDVAGIEVNTSWQAMGSDDMANILERVPGVWYMVGAGVDDPAKRCAQHNPHIVFKEEIMPKAVAVYCETVVDYFNE